jgi:protein-S-isoprenylcysteine O-methyltransferase Ste14
VSRRAAVATALAWGVLNHGLFALAIGAMVCALYSGLTTGLGALEGASAWSANALLVAQFPLLHSFLLSRAGRARLQRLAPRAVARELAPTTFTILASLQVLATFVLWSPSGVVLWEAHGAVLWSARAFFAVSWILLVVALAHAGLHIQTGSVGWWSVVRGRQPSFGDFPTRGLFRLCRQPVYLAFALTLWAGPVYTLDRVVLASAWTAYCFTAPRLKERRYLSYYGERFARYRAAVPYILPRLKP